MLIQLIRRAKYLISNGIELAATPSFGVLLKNSSAVFWQNQSDYLHHFAAIDDHDIWASIKFWQYHPDKVLSLLSTMLLERKLFKADLANEPFAEEENQHIVMQLLQKYAVEPTEISYLFTNGTISNAAYVDNEEKIWIKKKNGEVIDIVKASDLPSIEALSKSVTKFYRCYPKLIKKPL
ncbi:MAG: phosphohydrolase, partial [Flammeovirgaceae bacterium]|nr:phosphohydrolase [Flammeovirgaceae bacterium]